MNRSLRKRALLLTLCLGLSSCGGLFGGDDDPPPEPPPAPTAAEKIAALEDRGELPRLDRSASLAGPDVDANGIRDDIDIYIASQTYTQVQKTALQQLAKATQLAITANPADRDAVDAINLKDARAVNCAFAQFPASAGAGLAGKVAGDIERISTNTKERLLAYLRFAKASDGVVLPSPEGDTCD